MPWLTYPNDAIDTCDISWVQQRTPNPSPTCTIWLADGQFVITTGLRAAVQAAINAAAGVDLLVDLVTETLGTIGIAGAHVMRLRKVSALRTNWTMRGTPALITVPLSLAASVVIAESAAACGGGGGGGAGGEFTPVLTPAVGTTAAIIGSPVYLRSGGADAAEGDAVSAFMFLDLDVLDLATLSVVISGLPAPAAENSMTPVATVYILTGDDTLTVLAQQTGEDSVTVAAQGPATGATSVFVLLALGYPVAGEEELLALAAGEAAPEAATEAATEAAPEARKPTPAPAAKSKKNRGKRK